MITKLLDFNFTASRNISVATIKKYATPKKGDSELYGWKILMTKSHKTYIRITTTFGSVNSRLTIRNETFL